MLVLDATQRQIVAHQNGPLLVRGGPGTGKSTTLVESVAARVSDGIDPARILVLGFGRRGATRLRRDITVRLGGTGAEVPVYSFPGYAFAVLRTAAARRGQPPPHLLKGPEQDVIIRELLAEDRFAWPEEIRPALGTRAFATQLRDLLLRATERGVSAPELVRLAHRHHRPEWITAAAFMSRYVDILALRSMTGGAVYDSAEIVRAAATELADQPDLIPRPEAVFVDELQDTDPAHRQLLTVLAGGGGHLVAFGDSDSATFGFRGGDATAMTEFTERFRTVTGEPAPEKLLTVAHRSAVAPLTATTAVAQRLRGTDRYRHRVPRGEVGAGQVSAVTLPTVTTQAGHIAQWLRHAHLAEEVPWSRMAVLVKSAAEQLPVIARTLRHCGVPVEVGTDDRPLSAQPVVRHLLTVIRCAWDPSLLDEDTAVALLHSPYGGADALLERRLRQELVRIATVADNFRSAGELLVELLRDPTDLAELPDEQWARPARRICALLECARQAKGSVEDVLWQLWDTAGIAERLTRRALSTDPRSVAADDDLDAVMTLFAWAADFTDRLPGAGADMFAQHVLEQVLPADTLAPRAHRGEAVSLLTAHAAKGREWDLVVVAGVQEGQWPNLRPRGSLLGAEYLVDVTAGRAADDVDAVAVLLDEERRLFLNACTRARDRLLVTAVADDDELQPSRFLDELDVPVEHRDAADRPVTLTGLVAELRTAAAGPAGEDRDAAIALLSRLARQGVPGADPDDWWGLRELSDDRPLALPGERLDVSPSALSTMNQCGLRWMLENHGGNEPPGLPQQIGNLMHAAAETAAGLPADEQEAAMTAFIEQHADALPTPAPWTVPHNRRAMTDMTDAYLSWLHRNDRELVAAEHGFRVDLPAGDTGVDLRLKGSIDRVEQDLSGIHIVDLKTGDPMTKKEAATDPQLAAYQFAVDQGAVRTSSGSAAGASLVYLSKAHEKTGAVVREQAAPADDPQSQQARRTVVATAQAMTAATFEAVHTDRCRTCRVKQCCPISGRGTAVTE